MPRATTFSFGYSLSTPTNVTKVLNASGGRETLIFDSDYNLTTRIDPLGNRTTSVWDGNYNMTSVEDPRGFRTTYVYQEMNDSTWRIQAIKYPDGGRFTYVNDLTSGNILALIDPLTTVRRWSGTPERAIATPSLTPSTSGRPTPTTPAGRSRRFPIASGNGRRTSTIPWAAACHRRSALESHDLRLQRLQPACLRAESAGPGDDLPAGRDEPPTVLVDARGHRTSYAYDADCRLERVTDPRNALTDVSLRSPEPAGGDDRPTRGRTSFVYDKVGNRIAVINPLNERTTSVFDLSARMIAQVDPLLNRTTFVYDPAGNQERVVDPLNHISTTLYDGFDRPYAQINPLGFRSTFSYDLAGNLHSQRNPLNQITTLIYDSRNSRVAVVDPLNRRTTTVYDAAVRPAGRGQRGRVSHHDGLRSGRAGRWPTVDPLLARTTFTFDAASRTIAVTNARNYRTSMQYDPVGNLLATSDALNERTTMAYDADSNRIRVQDATVRLPPRPTTSAAA